VTRLIIIIALALAGAVTGLVLLANNVVALVPDIH
jgi:hypothetical protein